MRGVLGTKAVAIAPRRASTKSEKNFIAEKGGLCVCEGCFGRS
jgi:hypothetical protein